MKIVHTSLPNRMGSDIPSINAVHDPGDVPPATSVQDFEFIKPLGEGTFAKVFLARRLANKRLCAVKVIDKGLVISSNETEHTNAEL